MPRVLPLEILAAGVVAVWLLTVVPAGAITATKGRWDLFGWGFLSFGLPWFAGAVAPASRRTIAAWGAAAAVAVVLLGTLIVRPAPVLGISGESLGESVPNRGNGYLSFAPPLPPCEHQDGGLWTCRVYENGWSGGAATYEVRVNGRGCWTARRAEGGFGKLSGCIWLPDYFG